MTAAIRVVRPPRDKSRSVPVWPVGSSGSISVQGRTPHFESRRRRCEVADRIATIPSVSGGNDAHDTRVDWAANRGHRPGALRLVPRQAPRPIRFSNLLSTAGRIDRCHNAKRRSYRRECDQLCPDHRRFGRRRLEHLRWVTSRSPASRPASRRRTTTRRSASRYSPARSTADAVTEHRSRSPASERHGHRQQPVERGGHVQPAHQRLVPARGREQPVTSTLSIPQGSQLLVPSSAAAADHRGRD